MQAVETLTGVAPATKSKARPAESASYDPRAAFEWIYRDETGAPLFRSVRTPEKQFWQSPADGHGGWVKAAKGCMDGVRLVPLYLPEVLAAIRNSGLILIAEGERKVDLLRHLGYAATCNVSGAIRSKLWIDHAKEFFSAGCYAPKIIVLPDKDEAGRKHADTIGAAFAAVGVTVHILELPGLDDKEDVINWYDRGGTREQLDDLIDSDARPWTPGERESVNAEPARPLRGEQETVPALLPVYKPFPIDETSIPPRAWVVPGFLMRRHVTVLVAPSGSGKSLLTLQLGLASAKGKSWAGWFPRGKFQVFVVNSEDDINEMRRRLAAAARAMEYDQNELRDSFILADESYEVVLAKFDARSKSLIRTPLFEQLVSTIIENKVDILFVDPFAETFEGDENSNSELKWACMLWREVARRTDTAVCLVHHTKKYASGMAGDVDAARGASALIGVARIVATLFPMTPGEAELMQVPEEQRVHYLRFDDAKANLNLKSPFARWFRKESFALDNATADLPADDVGALIPWSPPGIMDGISEPRIQEFFARVDAGLLDSDGLPSGEFYTFSAAKKDGEASRYIVDFIKAFFQIAEQARAAKIVALWKENHRLIEADYTSPKQRKTRKCVHSERWKPEKTNDLLQTET